jgi:hypothetical protein
MSPYVANYASLGMLSGQRERTMISGIATLVGRASRTPKIKTRPPRKLPRKKQSLLLKVPHANGILPGRAKRQRTRPEHPSSIFESSDSQSTLVHE